MALPTTDAFRLAAAHELWTQFSKSMRRKIVMLVIATAAIGGVVLLDHLKLGLHDSRKSAYLISDVITAVDANAELKKAAAAVALETPEARYATADDAFKALLEQTNVATALNQQQTNIRTNYESRLADIDRRIDAALKLASAGAAEAEEAKNDLAALKARRAEVITARTAELAEMKKSAQAAVQKRYAGRLASIDEAIRAAVTAAPSAAVSAAEKARATLTSLKAQRADLIAARAAELSEAEQGATAKTASLQQAFNGLNVAVNAKTRFKPSGNERLDKFVEHVVDPDHPLSIIYDVFWYACLIIGVIAFVALILTPLFKTLPVGGAEEPFMDQVRNLFQRAPRVAGPAIARLATLAIGTAAIVGVAANAPSSPANSFAVASSEQTSVTSQTTVTTATTTSTTLPPKPPVVDPPPPVVTKDPPPVVPDPRIDEIATDVKDLKTDNASHKTKLATLAPVPEQITALRGVDEEHKQKIENVFADAEDAKKRADGAKLTADTAKSTADTAKSEAEDAKASVGNVKVLVDAATTTINTKAAAIEEGVVVPFRVGERPSALRSFLGFDSYRVTDASAVYVEKAGAPQTVVDAVKAMKQTADVTNADLRRQFRSLICAGATNCELYVEWQSTVLRAARPR
jgi:hypothetical protein